MIPKGARVTSITSRRAGTVQGPATLPGCCVVLFDDGAGWCNVVRESDLREARCSALEASRKSRRADLPIPLKKGQMTKGKR